MSGESARRRACREKTAQGNAFRAERDAEHYRDLFQRRIFARGRCKALDVYLCPFCNRYHVGGLNRDEDRVEARRRQRRLKKERERDQRRSRRAHECW